jgi:hypothetical protein
MSEPAETIVREPVVEALAESHAETPVPARRDAANVEFLDASWADEFDRRLAVWQAEATDEPDDGR